MKDNALGRIETPGRAPGGAAMWRAVVRVLRSPVAVFEDVMMSAFPGDCRVCGGPLLFGVGIGAVCEDCIGRVMPQGGTLCGQCGEVMGMESERFAASLAPAEVLCSECRLVPPDFERAAAFGVYEGELREMTHLLKYEGVRSLAGVLGERLAGVIEGLGIEEAFMVAVPLFPAKERMRGYNQAVLLADAAARTLRDRVKLEAGHGCLGRVRDTESQYALSPKARRLNLRGAFAVADASRLAGRHVLLVDDIYTSGATARECARVLRKAGAARVWVATLSRAQREQVAMWDGVLGSQVSFGQGVQDIEVGRNG